mmetsp:Transcript_28810/g.68909  ORF Transcript_28810/g.68909 Transcript_28810/m.68909 type:complete len:302 (-) Transcript_28810:2855-3760(-)
MEGAHATERRVVDPWQQIVVSVRVLDEEDVAVLAALDAPHPRVEAVHVAERRRQRDEGHRDQQNELLPHLAVAGAEHVHFVEDDVLEPCGPLLVLLVGCEQQDAQALRDCDQDLAVVHVLAVLAREHAGQLAFARVLLAEPRAQLGPHLVDQRFGRRNEDNHALVIRTQAQLHDVVRNKRLAGGCGSDHQCGVPRIHNVEQPDLPGVWLELHAWVVVNARRSAQVLRRRFELKRHRAHRGTLSWELRELQSEESCYLGCQLNEPLGEPSTDEHVLPFSLTLIPEGFVRVCQHSAETVVGRA